LAPKVHIAQNQIPRLFQRRSQALDRINLVGSDGKPCPFQVLRQQGRITRRIFQDEDAKWFSQAGNPFRLALSAKG
jgi:hypothetical protein